VPSDRSGDFKLQLVQVRVKSGLFEQGLVITAFSQTILSVNAENERALSLYEQEGFRLAEPVVCYGYKLTPSD